MRTRALRARPPCSWMSHFWKQALPEADLGGDFRKNDPLLRTAPETTSGNTRTGRGHRTLDIPDEFASEADKSRFLRP